MTTKVKLPKHVWYSSADGVEMCKKTSQRDGWTTIMRLDGSMISVIDSTCHMNEASAIQAYISKQFEKLAAHLNEVSAIQVYIVKQFEKLTAHTDRISKAYERLAELERQAAQEEAS